MDQGTSETMSGANIAKAGKLFALLSYVLPFFFLLPILKRENTFALFHAKQALLLWLAAIAASIALTIVLMIIPIVILSTLLSVAFSIAVLGLVVLGVINAWNLREQPLPMIGSYADMIVGSFGVK